MEKKKRKIFVACMIVAAFIVLAAICIVFIWFLKKDKREEYTLKFDFGVDETLTCGDWTPVTVEKKNGENTPDYLYTEEKGFGFLGDEKMYARIEAEIDDNEYGIPNEVYSDSAIAGGRTFVVDLENGYYNVTFVVATKSTSTTIATVEGVESATMGTADKVCVTVVYNVLVEDGQLTISFDGSGTAAGMINALEISKVSAPKNLSASVSDDKVLLSFEGTDDAYAYNIYRADLTGSFSLIDQTKDLTYTDETALLYETYSYYVTAVTETGAESAGSETVSVSLTDESKSAPDAVSDITCERISLDGITLSWSAVSDALCYQVYVSDYSGTDGDLSGYTYVGRVDECECSYEGSMYTGKYFKVVSLNEGGASAPALYKSGSAIVTASQLETIARSVVAIVTDNGVYISFNILIDEYADNREFELYRDGELVKSFTSDEASNYIDAEGKEDSVYEVKAVKDGEILNTSGEVTVNDEQYYEVPLTVPAQTEDLPDGSIYTYSACDTEVCDMDGDGVYEYIVKWDPSNSKDNSQEGYTGNVIIDCYKPDGTLMWRINLGRNIRAGAHYTQMVVYDLDGDGLGEVLLKTADGTVDGLGNIIGDASADYRNESGYVLDGPEYLTLFDGKTGAALDTVEYTPERGTVSSWGDSYGNRVDRFLACVAYLDGETPSAVMCRGYYTRAVLAAYNVVNKKLVQVWVCDSNDSENSDLYGQGAHYATAADVDYDGKDEIVYGSAVVDDDGTLLYAIGTVNGEGGGHGDAIHIGDFDLTNPGLEIFMVHETYPNEAGIEMHDAATGKYLYTYYSDTDVGRGACADIDPRYLGAESFAASYQPYLTAADGTVIANVTPVANFVILWDGDTGYEIFDHVFSSTTGIGVPTIYEWNYETYQTETILSMDGCSTNNWTKGNACIQADIMGDWREEVVVRTTDSSALRIYTTTDYTDFRLYTLMHDRQYRVQVASQNCAYNQPPHTSFYIGFDTDYIVPNILPYYYATTLTAR